MISIPAPTAVVLLILLLIIGILVGAIVHARRKSSELSIKLAAAKLRQQEDERELTQRSALDSLKDEFVSTVSHELRTPLTSIRGALGLLSSGVFGNLDAKSKNLLRIALTNTDRLIRLINDLLDLERMDSGVAILQMKRCSLNEMVGQATETMTALADAGHVKLVVAPTAKSILPSIYFDADPDRILQVLTNLLSNAIKFSPTGSSVTIEVETPPDELIFRIVDQGRGIPEDQLESIFERFKQVPHPDAKAIGGTGLGLAICRSIIQQHGGSVWAKRNVARGATICVRLPRQQRTHDAATSSPSPSPELGTSLTGEAQMSGQPKPHVAASSGCQILLCDDNNTSRAVLVMQLRASGHLVHEASTSAAAIEVTRRLSGQSPNGSPIQAIVLSMHMAEMKNWDFLKQMMRNPATEQIPIACLNVAAALDSPLDRQNGQPRNGAHSISVPVHDDHLLADLGRALDSERGPGRILLVEDDLDLANAVLSGFVGTNVLVEHAATLHRARLLCQERRPDLIMLDLAIPDGDGLALIRWMRTRPELRTLPLVVYSGREAGSEDEHALRLGPTRLLSRASVPQRDLDQLVLALTSGGLWVAASVRPAEQSIGADA